MGWVFAATWLAGTFWWLFVSLHTHGGLAAPLAVGAVLGLFLGLPMLGVQGLAFAGGVAAVLLVIALGKALQHTDRTLVLVLTGVVLGALVLAGLPEVLRHVAGPLQAMTDGRLDSAILRQLLIALAMIIIMLLRPRGLWPSPEHGKSLTQKT